MYALHVSIHTTLSICTEMRDTRSELETELETEEGVERFNRICKSRG